MLEERIRAARGEKEADLLIRGAKLVNVLSGRIHETGVAVSDGRIAGFGDYPAKEVVDAAGRWVCPGLMDAHVHVESSMVTVPEYARAVVPRGTTTIFTDPHEIANVLGLEGIRYMIHASEGLPLDVYFLLSSCVPATDMETSGARLTADDLALLINHPRVVGLAEMMNFPGVIHRTPEVLAKLETAAGLPKDGHAPGLRGRDLAAYVAAGIGSDHECTELEEAAEKLAVGLHIMIREGSSARNLEALLPLVTPESAGRFSFCTDDRHPYDLLFEGHMDHLVRTAVRKGLPPVTAVQLASLNTARYFGFRDLGAVAPGYRADFLLLDDLESFTVHAVYKNGRKVAEGGRYLVDGPGAASTEIRGTMTVDWPRLELEVPAPAGKPPRARVIGVVPGQIVTRGLERELKVEDGLAVADPGRGLLKMAVVERHLGTGNVGLGFVEGVGLRGGAMASSVAHDSHNIVVVGADDHDMLTAVIEVVRMRGGQAVVEKGRVLANQPLPIAGLMSDRSLEVVLERSRALYDAARGLGCVLEDPMMTLSFLALPVIPELKLTDRGLVDVGLFRPVPLFVD